MTDLHDIYNQVIILNGVDDSIGSLTYSVSTQSSEFFNSSWTRIFR